MNKKKILIVEDVLEFYDKLAEFFIEKDFEIIREDEDSFVDNYEKAVELCKQHDPDIALLDIRINNKDKDGIDLAIWLKEQYNIPIIFLSDKDTYGNLERIKKYPEFRFFMKANSEEKLRELWFNVQVLLSQENQPSEDSKGIWFKVRSVPYTYFSNVKNSLQTFKDEFGNHQDRERLFRFSEIMEIRSLNDQGWGRNNIVLIEKDKVNVHIVNTTLNAVEEELPYPFVRINSGTIIYGRLVNSKGKSDNVYYIDDQRYEISKDFKGSELALRKLRRLYGK